MINIPTAVTEEESRILSALASDKHVYEAGSLLGYSTVLLSRTALSVVAVDPHSGYPRRNPYPTWDPFLFNLESHGCKNVLPIRDVFQNVKVNGHGFAWADLNGEYDLTLDFLQKTAHVPAIAIHDYARGGCSGATRAIDWWIRTRNERASRFGTLIVLDRRKM